LDKKLMLKKLKTASKIRLWIVILL